MCFLCKRKKTMAEVDAVGGIMNNKSNRKGGKFSVDLGQSDGAGKLVKTSHLVKAVHDVTDILNLHHKKIYYHINEFYRLNEIAKDYVCRVEQNNLKKDHSF